MRTPPFAGPPDRAVSEPCSPARPLAPVSARSCSSASPARPCALTRQAKPAIRSGPDCKILSAPRPACTPRTRPPGPQPDHPGSCTLNHTKQGWFRRKERPLPPGLPAPSAQPVAAVYTPALELSAPSRGPPQNDYTQAVAVWIGEGNTLAFRCCGKEETALVKTECVAKDRFESLRREQRGTIVRRRFWIRGRRRLWWKEGPARFAPRAGRVELTACRPSGTACHPWLRPRCYPRRPPAHSA